MGQISCTKTNKEFIMTIGLRCNGPENNKREFLIEPSWPVDGLILSVTSIKLKTNWIINIDVINFNNFIKKISREKYAYI